MNFLNLTYLYTTRRKEILENYENENLETKFTKNENKTKLRRKFYRNLYRDDQWGRMLRNFLTFKQFEQLYLFLLSFNLIIFLLLLF